MIPKIIHQIWITKGCKIPTQCLKYSLSIRKVNPSWKYVLWTAPDSVSSFLSLKATPVEDYNKIIEYYKLEDVHPAFISDVLRVLLLYKYGGVYLDMDVEAVKPMDSVLNVPFFAGYHGDTIEGAVFGSVPEGEIVTRLKETLDANRGLNLSPIEGYGIAMFSKAIKSIIETDDVTLHKTTVFHEPRNPDSIVIHHFLNTWREARRKIRL